MPVLATPEDGNIPESDTIARYLLDKFDGKGPSFRPSSVAARAKSDLLCRLHDVYITSIQVCVYVCVCMFVCIRAYVCAFVLAISLCVCMYK
jgi:hypothetical protein